MIVLDILPASAPIPRMEVAAREGEVALDVEEEEVVVEVERKVFATDVTGLDILPANAPKETAESVDLSATDVTG